MIGGNHGSATGESGLSVKESLSHDIYKEECKTIGIKAGPRKRLDELPLQSWLDVPDITKPAEKLTPSQMTSDCFYSDEELKEMDIRLANMSYYHSHGDKLIDDINEECFIRNAYI